MEIWLARSPWMGVILWMILYISDYYLTVYSARGSKKQVCFNLRAALN